VGRNLRKATELVHATVLTNSAGGPVATSYVGVFSRSGETARIGLPAGWSSGTFVDFGPAATPTLLTQTAGGPEARMPLDTGQFGMVHGTGPIDVPGAASLEVSAGSENGGPIVGEVRNATPFRLEGVAVFVGSDTAAVGALAPGENRSFVVNPGQARFDGGNPEFRVWGGPQFGEPDSVTDFGLWQAALRGGGVNFLAPDAAVAAGWTRDYSPEVQVGGRTATPEGRTVVVGRSNVRPPARGATTIAARREIVRDPFADRFGGGRGGGSVVRFVFPEGADTSNLFFPNVFGSAEVWQDGAWRATACDGADCTGPGANVGCPPNQPCAVPLPGKGFAAGMKLTVPAASVLNGVAYVRLPGPATLEQPQVVSIGRSA
jgi:hypothetical protein